MGLETALLIGSLVATAVGTASSISSSNQQAKQAKNAANDQAQKQSALESAAASRAANEESAAKLTETRDAAKNRQQNLAVGAGGGQDTILTGPAGVIGNPSGQQKTLLGT